MSVGNDVVDLADPETRLEGLHPRFLERAFCAAERDRLETSRSRHALHWALWAAKESAYKALKRLVPETVFSPKEFEVDLAPLPPAGAAGLAAGWVRHRGHLFELEVQLDAARLHAVAKTGDVAGAGVLRQVGRALGDPGVAVRRLAVAAIGAALGLDPTSLRIVGRPPVAAHLDGRLAADVSLSHHGRFVACAGNLAGREGYGYERLLPRCSWTVSETISPSVSK